MVVIATIKVVVDQIESTSNWLPHTITLCWQRWEGVTTVKCHEERYAGVIDGWKVFIQQLSFRQWFRRSPGSRLMEYIWRDDSPCVTTTIEDGRLTPFSSLESTDPLCTTAVIFQPSNFHHWKRRRSPVIHWHISVQKEAGRPDGLHLVGILTPDRNILSQWR